VRTAAGCGVLVVCLERRHADTVSECWMRTVTSS
jgi:hypothetical protein